ncbi:hypothetical protein GCM10007416_16320 [Kroppenstedtia guangzhouensis]|uniref:Cyclodeaminase/cyclohydrolase domain-containing protein n=1 Tax=Kroppenstedtia guangzhouensis TaxID=1274356 RepID=A0ABQ1GIK0_9BACL|nr:hypothetical protein [Kroppenstedtia guangzhouensis]GGA43945.1 hypothetical protein GCM10007416_16320 [Kroppenstedtia guangzhouensis]
MNKYVNLPMSVFADEMAKRKIPSPAAGSSLAASLMMAISLLELTVSEQAEKKGETYRRDPSQDLKRLQRWREEGKVLVDKDIQAVEEMVRRGSSVGAERLLAPVRRLHELAREILKWIPDYLTVSGAKVSDTLIAALHLRTVLIGSWHIAGFNAKSFGWDPPLPFDWETELERTDSILQMVYSSVQD